MAITVLCSLQNPDAQMSLYGLAIPYQYLPFAQLVMSYMFTQQIPWQDLVGAIVVRNRSRPSPALLMRTHITLLPAAAPPRGAPPRAQPQRRAFADVGISP